MDSLLANYASSDEEEEETRHQQPHLPPPKPTSSSSSSSSSSLFSSLPKPKSSSSSSSSSPFQSLPKPQKSLQNPTLLEDSRTTPKPSSLFSSLPQPKSQNPTSKFSSSETKSKRVVQFTPPINPFYVKSSKFDDDDEDEEGEEKERRRRRESESSSGASKKESLLSFMPAPKNSVSLGVLPSAGSARRAIIETDVPMSNSGDSKPENNDSMPVNDDTSGGTDNSGNYGTGIAQDAVNYAEYYSYGNYESGNDQNGVNYGYYENYNSGMDQSGDGSGYGGYGSYHEYGQQCGNNWAEGSAATTVVAVPVPEVTGASQSGFGVKGKRGRSEIPTEIVEVKQDELMKNRPREDQAKLTGIAFGPSYQPVSTKGKPSKLHKRKHQISSLYYDMKQKEMELAERRSKGFLTKAETQAKYGW